MADIRRIKFFKTVTGREPVKAWLKSLTREERKVIGEDVRTLQRGWPIGMPLARKLEKSLWEVRSSLPTNVIARIIFTESEDILVLLHAFIKKTEKTPKKELTTARNRLTTFREQIK